MSRKSFFVASILFLASVTILQAAESIRCESNDKRYHECTFSTPGRVRLDHQLSRDACERGRTWGVKNDRTVWVDRGCRADFVIRGRDGYGGVQGESSVIGRTTTVRCESEDNRRKRCDADTEYGVRLERQLSKDRCVEGRDWGYDARGIWVDHGCRADFTLNGRAETQSSRPAVITCESQDKQRKRCSADTRYGAQLLRQLSKESCVEGRDWGYDSRGIWVDHGCRGEFTINGMR